VADARIVATWLDGRDAPTLDLRRGGDAAVLRTFLARHAIAPDPAPEAAGAADVGRLCGAAEVAPAPSRARRVVVSEAQERLALP
jgi:hypothetical protein